MRTRSRITSRRISIGELPMYVDINPYSFPHSRAPLSWENVTQANHIICKTLRRMWALCRAYKFLTSKYPSSAPSSRKRRAATNFQFGANSRLIRILRTDGQRAWIMATRCSKASLSWIVSLICLNCCLAWLWFWILSILKKYHYEIRYIGTSHLMWFYISLS